jgi:hypothetical protein
MRAHKNSAINSVRYCDSVGLEDVDWNTITRGYSVPLLDESTVNLPCIPGDTNDLPSSGIGGNGWSEAWRKQIG